MNKPTYEYNFKKRTILYLIIGVSCVLLDFSAFIGLSKFLNPLFANPIAYGLGSISSFLLNRKFTFKSNNSRLSPLRFFIIILIGFSASQAVVFVGIRIFGVDNYLFLIKWLAMIISVSLQYLGNTFYGSKSKKT